MKVNRKKILTAVAMIMLAAVIVVTLRQINNVFTGDEALASVNNPRTTTPGSTNIGDGSFTSRGGSSSTPSSGYLTSTRNTEALFIGIELDPIFMTDTINYSDTKSNLETSTFSGDSNRYGKNGATIVRYLPVTEPIMRKIFSADSSAAILENMLDSMGYVSASGNIGSGFTDKLGVVIRDHGTLGLFGNGYKLFGGEENESGKNDANALNNSSLATLVRKYVVGYDNVSDEDFLKYYEGNPYAEELLTKINNANSDGGKPVEIFTGLKYDPLTFTNETIDRTFIYVPYGYYLAMNRHFNASSGPNGLLTLALLNREVSKGTEWGDVDSSGSLAKAFDGVRKQNQTSASNLSDAISYLKSKGNSSEKNIPAASDIKSMFSDLVTTLGKAGQPSASHNIVASRQALSELTSVMYPLVIADSESVGQRAKLLTSAKYRVYAGGDLAIKDDKTMQQALGSTTKKTYNNLINLFRESNLTSNKYVAGASLSTGAFAKGYSIYALHELFDTVTGKDTFDSLSDAVKNAFSMKKGITGIDGLSCSDYFILNDICNINPENKSRNIGESGKAAYEFFRARLDIAYQVIDWLLTREATYDTSDISELFNEKDPTDLVGEVPMREMTYYFCQSIFSRAPHVNEVGLDNISLNYTSFLGSTLFDTMDDEIFRYIAGVDPYDTKISVGYNQAGNKITVGGVELTNEQMMKVVQFRQWELQGAILAIAAEHGMSEEMINACTYGFNIKYGEVDMFQYSVTYSADDDSNTVTKKCREELKKQYEYCLENPSLVNFLSTNGQAFVTTPSNMSLMMYEAATADWKLTMASADLALAGANGSKGPVFSGGTKGNTYTLENKSNNPVLVALKQLGSLNYRIINEGTGWDSEVGLDASGLKNTATSLKSPRATNLGDINRRNYIMNIASRNRSIGMSMISRHDDSVIGSIMNWALLNGGNYPFAFTATHFGYGARSSSWSGYITYPLSSELTDATTISAVLAETKYDTGNFKSSYLQIRNEELGDKAKSSGLINTDKYNWSTAFRTVGSDEIENTPISDKYTSAFKGDTGLQVERKYISSDNVNPMSGVFGLRHVAHMFDQNGTTVYVDLIKDGQFWRGTNGNTQPLLNDLTTGIRPFYQSSTSWNSALLEKTVALDNYLVNAKPSEIIKNSTEPKDSTEYKNGIYADTETTGAKNYGTDGKHLNYELSSTTGHLLFYACFITAQPEERLSEVNGILGFENLETADKGDIVHEIYEPKAGETAPKLVFGVGLSGEIYDDLAKYAEECAAGKANKSEVPEYILYYNLVGVNNGSSVSFLSGTKTKNLSKYSGEWLSSALKLKEAGALDIMQSFAKEQKDLINDITADSNTLRIGSSSNIRNNAKYGFKKDKQLASYIKTGNKLSDKGFSTTIGNAKVVAGDNKNCSYVVLNDLVKSMVEKGESAMNGAGMQANTWYDLKIAEWDYNSLFKNQLADKETTGKLKYGNTYSVGMEYYIVKVSKSDTKKDGGKDTGKANTELAYFEIAATDSVKDSSATYKALVNKGETISPLDIAGTGWLNGMYRQSDTIAAKDKNKKDDKVMLLFRDKDETWPGMKTSGTNSKSDNSHMYIKINRNLFFPVQEDAEVLWKVNNKHNITKDDGGVQVNKLNPSAAYANIEVAYKNQDETVKPDDELAAWEKALKNKGIDAIAIYVYNGLDYESENKTDSGDWVVGIGSGSTAGTFGSDSYILSRGDFIDAISYGKKLKLPFSLPSTQWLSIMDKELNTPSLMEASTYEQFIQYSFKIRYLGIVDGTSLIETKNPSVSNGDSKYKAALTSGKVVYDLLTGEVVSDEVLEREMGYHGNSREELDHKCWLDLRSNDNPDYKIIRSRLTKDDVEAYATIKEGTVGSKSTTPSQNWDVMTGVASTEKIYFATGGDEFIYEIGVREISNESTVRTYVSSFEGIDCKFKTGDLQSAGGGSITSVKKKGISHAYDNMTSDTTLTDSFTIPEPKDADSTGTCYKVPAHGGVTIMATWTGTIANMTSDPGISDNKEPIDKIAADGTFYVGHPGHMTTTGQESSGGSYAWDVAEYNRELGYAKAWVTAMEAASNGNGNIITHSDSDRGERRWHAGTGQISITITGLTREAAINAGATHSNSTKAHGATWTDVTNIGVGSIDTYVLEDNDARLSSGYREVYGRTAQITVNSCDLKTGSGVVKSADEGGTITWTDEIDLAAFSPTTLDRTIKTKANHNESCTGTSPCNCHPDYDTQYVSWQTRWCGFDVSTKLKDATYSHSTSSTNIGTAEDPEYYYSCTFSSTAGCTDLLSHTCFANHSVSRTYNVSTTAKVPNIQYKIAVTFKDTYLDAVAGNVSGDGEKGTASTVACSGGNIPKHSLCGPCCQHKLPAITDNWLQEITYSYVSIEDMNVLKIGRSLTEDLNKILYDYDSDQYEFIVTNINRGEPNVWYNVGDFNAVYHTKELYGYKQQASLAGRIRYSLEPQQFDEVVWIELHNGTTKRPQDCDGQTKPVNKNPIQFNGKTGHALAYSKGMLYARTIEPLTADVSLCFDNCTALERPVNYKTGLRSTGGTDVNKVIYGKSDTVTVNGKAQNVVNLNQTYTVNGAVYGGGVANMNYTINEKVNGLTKRAETLSYYNGTNTAIKEVYTNTPDWFSTISGAGVKEQYQNNAIDAKDTQTFEYKRFKERRETKVSAIVSSDLFVVQTSTKDIPVVFAETAPVTVKADNHFDSEFFMGYDKAVTSNCTVVSEDENNTDWLGRIEVGGYLGNGNRNGGAETSSYPTSIFSSGGVRNFNKSVLDTTYSGNSKYNTDNNSADAKSKTSEAIMQPRAKTVAAPAEKYGEDTWKDTYNAEYFSACASLFQRRISPAEYLKIGKYDLQINPITENGIYKMHAYQTWIPIIRWHDEIDAKLNFKDSETGGSKSIPFAKIYEPEVVEFGDNKTTAYGKNDKILYKEAEYYPGATKVNDVIIHTPISNLYTYMRPYDGPIEDQRIYNGVNFDDTSVTGGTGVGGTGNASLIVHEYCPGKADLCDHAYLKCDYLNDQVVYTTTFASKAILPTRDEYGNLVSSNLDVTYTTSTSNSLVRVIDTTNRLMLTLPVGNTLVSEGTAGQNMLMMSSGAYMEVRLADIGITPTTGTKIRADFKYRVANVTNEKHVLFSIGTFRVFVKRGIAGNIFIEDGNGYEYKYNVSAAIGQNINLGVVFTAEGIDKAQLYVNGTKVNGTKSAGPNGDIPRISPSDMGNKIVFGYFDNKDTMYLDNVTITRLGGSTTHTEACYETITTHSKTEQWLCMEPKLYGTSNVPQEFKAPVSGVYVIEAYGAAGGGVNTTLGPNETGNAGGLGGYTKASVYLTKGQSIYIYVGGQGTTANGGKAGGGWNGGGNGSGSGYGGGGMTHISYGKTDKQVTGYKNVPDIVDVAPLTSYQKVLDVNSATSGTVALQSGLYYVIASSNTNNYGGGSTNGRVEGTLLVKENGNYTYSTSATETQLKSGSTVVLSSKSGGNASYMSNISAKPNTGICLRIFKVADFTSLVNVKSATSTVGTTTINPLATPVNKLNATGTTAKSVTLPAGLYRIELGANKTDIADGYMGAGFALFKQSTTVNYSTSGNNAYLKTSAGAEIMTATTSSYSVGSMMSKTSGSQTSSTHQVRINQLVDLSSVNIDLIPDNLADEMVVAGTGSVATVAFENSTPGAYSIPLTAGEYTLEVWGAQGGSSTNANATSASTGDAGVGGKGGYSKGKLTVTGNTTLYGVIGGSGYNSTSRSYNGGGAGSTSYGGYGGGATHIATANALLKDLISNPSSILIIAGGGGAGYKLNGTAVSGGAGGGGIGVAGGNGTQGSYGEAGKGATASAGGAGGTFGGEAGTFGVGGSAYSSSAVSISGSKYIPWGDASWYTLKDTNGNDYILEVTQDCTITFYSNVSSTQSYRKDPFGQILKYTNSSYGFDNYTSVKSDDDNGDGNNFSMVYNASAGEKLKFQVRNYSQYSDSSYHGTSDSYTLTYVISATGGTGTDDSRQNTRCGGGAGYYGGGAGGNNSNTGAIGCNDSSAGGGSSYISATLNDRSGSSGVRTGDGKIKITRAADPYQMQAFNTFSVSNIKVEVTKQISTVKLEVDMSKVIMMAAGGGGAGSNASVPVSNASNMSGGNGGLVAGSGLGGNVALNGKMLNASVTNEMTGSANISGGTVTIGSQSVGTAKFTGSGIAKGNSYVVTFTAKSTVADDKLYIASDNSSLPSANYQLTTNETTYSFVATYPSDKNVTFIAFSNDAAANGLITVSNIRVMQATSDDVNDDLISGQSGASGNVGGAGAGYFGGKTTTGGGCGGTSYIDASKVMYGSTKFEDGINTGSGKVIITLSTHTHDTDGCTLNNGNYNYHAHTAACILGTQASKEKLYGAVRNAKNNNDWTELCTLLGASNASQLANIKSGAQNVYSAVTNYNSATACSTVESIVKNQSVNWIANVMMIGTDYNPIITCHGKYTAHVCDSGCITSQMLDCNEPHHNGGHYAHGDEICYEACHVDANHKTTNTGSIEEEYNNPIPGMSADDIAVRQQLDDYFTLHWDNRGHFYDANGEGVYWTASDVKTARGNGFYNKHDVLSTMDTTRWIRAKVMMFDDVDVIFYNEHTGLWEYHARGTMFYVPVVSDGIINGNDDVKRNWRDPNDELNRHPVTEYKFYMLLENNEFDDTKYHVWTLALNEHYTNDKKETPYVIASDTVDTTNKESDNKYRPGANGDYAAFETCYNWRPYDVVGSIGNLLVSSTTDFRYSNFFKETTDEWLVNPFIHQVNEANQSRYLGIGIRNQGGTYNIIDVRFRPVEAETNYYNTWGKEPWTNTSMPFNKVDGDMYSIVSADIRSTYATEDMQMVIGYDIFTEVTTIGDYNNLHIRESYYLLDKETGKIYDCDVWVNTSEGYKATYLAGMTSDELRIAQKYGLSSLTSSKYSLVGSADFDTSRKSVSIAKESGARQILRSEIERTQGIDDKLYGYRELVDNNGDGTADAERWVSAAEQDMTVNEVLQYIGDVRNLKLGNVNRTYVGSSYTNVLKSIKYNPTGTFNGGKSTNVDGSISEDKFAKQARRWFFTLGLPETAYVVPYSNEFCTSAEYGKHLNPNQVMADGKDPINDLLYEIGGEMKDRFRILIGIDTIATGDVWDLEWEAFKEPQELHFEGKSYVLDKRIPDIIAILDIDNVSHSDWDIIKTH